MAPTYGDLEDGLVDSARQSRNGVRSNHIADSVHLGLPDGRSKHDQRGNEVYWTSPNSKGDRDEDDAADRESRHVGSIPVIEHSIAHPELDVEILPEGNCNAKTWDAVSLSSLEPGAGCRASHIANTMSAYRHRIVICNVFLAPDQFCLRD